jgi:hypothetical protein
VALTFVQLVKRFFGSIRPVSDQEVDALKASMSPEAWSDFVAEVKAAS